MGLKAFHILFVTLSSLLAFVFAGWSAKAWKTGQGGTYLGLALASAVVGVTLVIYGFWFWRKITTQEEEKRRRRKTIHGAVICIVMAVGLTNGPPALACSTCFGQAEGPLIDAARLGVWLLFGLVLAVQLAFALFFLKIWRRSRQLAAREQLLGTSGFAHGRSYHP